MQGEERVGGVGFGVTAIVFGLLAAVSGVAIGAYFIALFGVMMAVVGGSAIARRDETKAARAERAERARRSPLGLVVPIVAAVAFSIWGVVAGNPIALVAAAIWTAGAVGGIWRLTRGEDPTVRRG